MNQRSSFPAVVAAGLLILAVILGIFVWQPARDRVETLSADLISAKSELVQLQTELADLVALEAELPLADSERERILNSVPLELIQDEIIEDLDDIASSVGISLNAMSFSLQSSQDQSADVVSVTGNFTGNYTALIDLLEAIENNDRLFKVTAIGVQLGEVDGDSGEQLMTFSVSIEAYYQS